MWLDKLADLGSYKFWRRFHSFLAVVWLANIPIAVVTELKTSVAYLVFVSLAACFSSEVSGLHASRAEAASDPDTTTAERSP